MRFLLIAVSALSLYAQQTGNTFAPSQSAQPNNPPAGGLTVANPFSEYFDSTTQTAQWATVGPNCDTDAYAANQTAVAWYQASGTQTKPGFNYYSNGHGGCSTNPSVFTPGGSGSTGAGTFDLKWDSGFTADNLTLPAVGAFGAGFYSTFGGWAGVSTDPVGSMTGTTISLLCSTEQDGPTCGVFQGIPFYFNACAYITNSTTLTRTGSGDPFVAGLVNQQFFITDYLATGLTYHGPYTVTAQTSTTLTVSPAMSWSGISFGIAQIGTITGWAELSNFNQFVTGQGYGGTTIAKSPNPVVWWPYDGPLANLPIFTFEIYRDSSNNATFNVYAPTLQNGTSPWLTWSVNLVSGITYLGSQTSAFSLGYINVANKNANHTNWLGGVTTSSNPSSSTALSGWFGNFRGYGVVTGTLPTVTGVVPTASGANFTSTTGVTINGANFNTSSTLHIGLGTSASTAVATTYVSSSQLTATLPTQSANGCLYGASATHTIFEASDATPCFYEFKVIDATGVEARLPLGINYESAVVNRIDPQEFTTGDTLTVTGSGFSSGGSMTIGGHTCGTYTYIDAAHFTCVVPSGITASSPPATVIVSNNSGSIFNSSVNSGTFNGTNPTQLAAGLSAHPYFLGTGTATTLSGIQTAFNSAITAGSGIAWDYAQNAVNTVANQPLNWSANVGMQSQSYQNSPILNTPAGLVCTYIANTPCYYPIRVQQMFDYAWHYLLAGDSPSLAQVTTLLPYHTNQIYSVDQMSTNTNLVASFHAEDAGSLAQLYDLMWPTWTAAQRTAILG